VEDILIEPSGDLSQCRPLGDTITYLQGLGSGVVGRLTEFQHRVCKLPVGCSVPPNLDQFCHDLPPVRLSVVLEVVQLAASSSGDKGAELDDVFQLVLTLLQGKELTGILLGLDASK